jgi:type I restriction enzyme R subunit
MLDTGIDVPELLNLVFFKPVKSKIKFWQMIGRGTRLSPDLFGEGEDKTSFNIFDICSNFYYFDMNVNGEPAQPSKALKERLFLKRVSLLNSMEEGSVKADIRAMVSSQVYALDSQEYNIKKQRHVVEALQSSDFNYMTDELRENLKTIAEYIEDETPTPVQRYTMLTLNAQEALVKGKENVKQIDEIKERCHILKSKALNVTVIKEQEKHLDAVLNGENSLESIESLEELKNNIAHLANLSLSKKIKPIKTTFCDEVLEVRTIDAQTFVPSASDETEVQKVLSAYIKNIPIIEELREKELISDSEIYELKHEVFNYEKILDDKLRNTDEFRELMQKILKSSKKEIANKIFDNFIEAGLYSQKQIEVSNKIKNILFGKKYLTLEASLKGVNEELDSDIHPLASIYDNLNDDEQDTIVELIRLLAVVDNEFGKSR